MNNFKGHNTEGESRNSGAKCQYPKPDPKAGAKCIYASLTPILLFLLITFAYAPTVGNSLLITVSHAADNGYFTPREFPTGQVAMGLLMVGMGLFVMPVQKYNSDKSDNNAKCEKYFKITHSVSSLWSSIYPMIKNIRAKESPSQKASVENLSESMLPISGAVTIILLKSYVYFARFSLCFLFIVLLINYHRAVVMSMSNIGKFQINCKLFTGGRA